MEQSIQFAAGTILISCEKTHLEKHLWKYLLASFHVASLLPWQDAWIISTEGTRHWNPPCRITRYSHWNYNDSRIIHGGPLTDRRQQGHLRGHKNERDGSLLSCSPHWSAGNSVADSRDTRRPMERRKDARRVRTKFGRTLEKVAGVVSRWDNHLSGTRHALFTRTLRRARIRHLLEPKGMLRRCGVRALRSRGMRTVGGRPRNCTGIAI